MVVGHRRVTYARSVDRDHRRVFLHAYQSDIDLKHTRPQHAVHILGVVGGGGGVYVCRVCVCVGGGHRHACIHNEHTMRVPLCTQSQRYVTPTTNRVRVAQAQQTQVCSAVASMAGMYGKEWPPIKAERPLAIIVFG